MFTSDSLATREGIYSAPLLPQDRQAGGGDWLAGEAGGGGGLQQVRQDRQ